MVCELPDCGDRAVNGRARPAYDPAALEQYYLARPDERLPGPLTPGEALAKLFMDNADRGANAANDALIEALRERAREIQALLPDTTTQE